MKSYISGLLQGTAYSRLHVNLSAVLMSYSVSIPEWKLLGQLNENGKLKLSELAEHLSYDPPMVTKLAKGLEKKALLKREHDSKDERAKIISITQKGSKLIQELEPIVKKRMGEILKGVTLNELEIYIKVLQIIVNNTRE